MDRNKKGQFISKLTDEEVQIIIDLINIHQRLAEKPFDVQGRIHRYISARFELNRHIRV